jgi:hypothetical protein
VQLKVKTSRYPIRHNHNQKADNIRADLANDSKLAPNIVFKFIFSVRIDILNID